MRSSWPARLLVVVQALAEGGWIAVVYAAVGVLLGDEPRLGPLELAILAGAGMAWARRRRLRSREAEAAGLPILIVLGGFAGWILDPQVRILLLDGFPGAALATHPAGWIGALAVLRGGLHGSREDDEGVQDRLLRFGIPGLAVPWLVGGLAATAALRDPFTFVAFISTMVFAASAFAALGLARLEAVRSTTGDWGGGRSWLALMVGIGLAVMVIGLPAALLLGVPLSALTILAFGPLRLILLVLILLSTPVILLIATVTELLRPLLPSAIDLPHFTLPSLAADPVRSSSPWPTLLVIGVVLVVALIELFFVGLMIWVRREERRRMAAVARGDFEERSIVVPPPEVPAAPTPPAPIRRRPDGGNPVGAYLAALDELERDARWRRGDVETPAMHARRIRLAGFTDAGFGRLALAYELVRYGRRALTTRETDRATGRLAAVRRALRRAPAPALVNTIDNVIVRD